jgi:hypothetical protein
MHDRMANRREFVAMHAVWQWSAHFRFADKLNSILKATLSIRQYRK